MINFCVLEASGEAPCCCLFGGGLYTTIFGVLAVALAQYIQHKMNLKLASSTFKNTGNSIKDDDYGFFKAVNMLSMIFWAIHKEKIVMETVLESLKECARDHNANKH